MFKRFIQKQDQNTVGTKDWGTFGGQQATHLIASCPKQHITLLVVPQSTGFDQIPFEFHVT